MPYFYLRKSCLFYVTELIECEDFKLNGSIKTKLDSLIIFRNLLSLPVVKSLIRLVDTDKENDDALVSAYSEFMYTMLSEDTNLSGYLFRAVIEDENIYTSYRLSGRKRDDLYENMLDRELCILTEVSSYDGSDIRKIPILSDMPAWRTEKIDFVSLYHENMRNINTKGYGIFAKYHMFVISPKGEIVPIKNPDPMTLDDLVGYERERGEVVTNTEAFLKSKNANNVLLYGDAGTGKSSTVKAIVNSMKNKGLRLIEFKKDQLSLIPKITEELYNNPLKFIFFIDDLTFTSDDKDFCALKATLEGGVTGRGNNTLIYATSNHRHMIKESASNRQDSVNTADMIQETVSLSARFGLTVTYLKTDREGFSRIVCELARRKGIDMNEEELVMQAEAFALRGGGRNPRTAKQFIDMLLTKD